MKLAELDDVVGGCLCFVVFVVEGGNVVVEGELEMKCGWHREAVGIDFV